MAIVNNGTTKAVTVNTVTLTPYEVYLRRVQACTDGLRSRTAGFDYYPFQLGGYSGQRNAINTLAVADVIDFRIDE